MSYPFQGLLLILSIIIVESAHSDQAGGVFRKVVKSGTTDSGEVSRIRDSNYDSERLSKARALSNKINENTLAEERPLQGQPIVSPAEEERDLPKNTAGLSSPDGTGAKEQVNTPSLSPITKPTASDEPRKGPPAPPSNGPKVDAGEFPEFMQYPGNE